jgi:NADP-dependent 3-hydroxy acid dehydrogenase YdfG
MSRVVFVTDIDTSLGNRLVSLFLEAGDRVFATSTNQDSPSSFAQVAGDSLTVSQWVRRSPVSARSMVLKAIAAYETVDLLVLLGPPDLGGPALLQVEAADIEEEIDGWIKGSLFLAREVISLFARRRGGVAALVGQNGGSGAGVVSQTARAGFRGLTDALLRSAGAAADAVSVIGFDTSSADVDDYAAFVCRALDEKAKKSAGKLFRHPGGLAATLRRR